ncbi:c-type cytochrome [Ramlibacter monticola]|nr:cytochrome c [Ramlibacter monticola]
MMNRNCIATLAAAAALAGTAPAFAQDTGPGQAFFERQCAACHQKGGTGLAGLAPPLAGALGPVLAAPEGRDYLLQVMVNGLSGKIVSKGQLFNLAMPPQGGFSDPELADAARYVASLNGSTASFAAEDVARARGTTVTHKQLRELRERLLK